MRVIFGENFDSKLSKAPTIIQKAFEKQANLLEIDIRHPSLHAKKYHEETGVWQARVNKDWRFYFIIADNTIIIINIKKHPK